MIKLSVVVPVYNVEDYIEQCIKSILNQSIKDIEIIVVDDGSTDNSIDKVQKFNDKRIKILKKENGGLSSARNFGINNSVGKYISFIDSDDYLAFNTALEEMYSIAINEEADVVVGNAIKYYSETKQDIFVRDKKLFVRESMTSDDFLINFRKSNSMHSSVCINIYRRELINQNNIKFKEGFFHEDEDFTPRIFLKANRVSIYPKNFYVYRSREGSIINERNIKKSYDLINICISLQEVFDEIQNNELKKVMGEDAAILLLKASYDNKIVRIPKGAKSFVLRNTKNIKLKIHSIIYCISARLYYRYLDCKR